MSGPFPVGLLMLEMDPFKDDFVPQDPGCLNTCTCRAVLVCFVKYMPAKLYPCRLLRLATFFGPRKPKLFLALLFYRLCLLAVIPTLSKEGSVFPSFYESASV